MRERAQRIEGKLRLNSSPNLGTKIDLTVPGRIVFRGTRSTWFTKFQSFFSRSDHKSQL
jgi:hypothetical protein